MGVHETVIGDRVTGLDGAHDFTEGRPRSVELATCAPGELRWLVKAFNKEFRRGECLVYGEVGVLGVLDEPLIR